MPPVLEPDFIELLNFIEIKGDYSSESSANCLRKSEGVMS